MVVVVVMQVGMPAGVSPGFWVEWGVDLGHMPSQGPHHFRNHMVGPDADVRAQELDG